MPDLAPISHLVLTVTDRAAASRFWTEVMGLTVAMEAPGFTLCAHPGTLVAVGLHDHDGTASGPFDVRRPGLDHVAFGVDSVEALHQWADHLGAHGVAHSPIERSEVGHHLNLRAPEGIPVELFVIDPATLAAMVRTARPGTPAP